MKNETLEALTACDPRTRAVFPLEGDILPLIQQMVADLDVCDAVPAGVKTQYERSRRLFVSLWLSWPRLFLASPPFREAPASD